MTSPSWWTRAIVPGAPSARARTSGRQLSSQNPPTDFISASIPGMSPLAARRITRPTPGHAAAAPARMLPVEPRRDQPPAVVVPEVRPVVLEGGIPHRHVGAGGHLHVV